jgi:uncharacterized protein (TIGR00730 family)
MSAIRSNYSLQNEALEDVIQSLVRLGGGTENDDLVREIVVTAMKLVHDGADRADVKLMNSALKELRHAARVFAPYRDRRKITIFGSARTEPDHPAYRLAVDFARRAAEAGYMVITGAGDGIMAAGHEGAGRAASFGVNIRLPFEQRANAVIVDDPKLINFKYFFTRKLVFLKETDAVVLFPGGAGTLDECFETLTLLQTGKSHPMPLILVEAPDDDYWEAWEGYVRSHPMARGLMSPEDAFLWTRTRDAADAVAEIDRFYRVFHSIRYVGDLLVLRLQDEPTPDRLEELNREFADILEDGAIETTAPLPDEANEPEIAHLPRLRLRFNRRDFGRLRQLIDALNEPAEEAGS